MKQIEYTLKDPIGNITSLVFTTPTRQHLSLASNISSAMMKSIKVGMEFQKHNIEKVPEAETEKRESGKFKPNEVMPLLAVGETNTAVIMEQFMTACTDSNVCKAQGVFVSKKIWDSMSITDIQGAFSEYVANFISI